MDSLRRARHLSRLLLAWFALAIAAAALPAGGAQFPGEVICSVAGPMKGLAGSEGETPQGHRHACGLCAVFALPPALPLAPSTTAPGETPVPAPQLAVLPSAGTPFDARGPPRA